MGEKVGVAHQRISAPQASLGFILGWMSEYCRLALSFTSSLLLLRWRYGYFRRSINSFIQQRQQARASVRLRNSSLCQNEWEIHTSHCTDSQTTDGAERLGGKYGTRTNIALVSRIWRPHMGTQNASNVWQALFQNKILTYMWKKLAQIYIVCVSQFQLQKKKQQIATIWGKLIISAWIF